MSNSDIDRPLVTFAVFAYNQEAFIREAIEGAFSQTYEPLEIILSDDCSGDRTFEIMQEMAAAYNGPHCVMVRRNAANQGLAMHVQSVANEMSGKFLVVAAGDDISRSDRVETLMDAWVASDRRAVVLHSWTHAEYVDGSKPDETIYFKIDDEINIEWRVKNRKGSILAPTAAYHRCLFDDFPPLIGGSNIEDGPMIMRGLLQGSFLGVPKPLVRQRKLNVSLGSGYSISNPIRWNSFVRSKIISQFNKLQDIGSAQKSSHSGTLERSIHRDIRRLSKSTLPVTIEKISLAYKVKVFFQMLFYYPGTYSLSRKVSFCLDFCELGWLTSSLKKESVRK